MTTQIADKLSINQRNDLEQLWSYYQRYELRLNSYIIEPQQLQEAKRALYIAIHAFVDHQQFSIDDIDQPFAAFAITSRFLLDNKQRAAAENIIKKWYCDDQLRAGVQQALLAFPRISMAPQLVNYFAQQPSLRSDLFQLYLQTGESIPENYLMQSLEQKDDLGLQAQAFYCAAWDQRYGLNIFRRFYKDDNIDVAINALLGGLMRGDETVLPILEQMGKLRISKAQQRQVKCFMAASGQARFDEQLKNYICSPLETETRCRLLLLCAYPKIIDILSELLQREASLVNAVQPIWQLITKYDLQEIGALQDGKIDSDICENWWRRQNWQADQRYLLGQPVTPQLLDTFQQQYMGGVNQDIAIMHSILQKKPDYPKYPS